MALTPRLDLRQSQSLVITPQLQQAIKLLQLSTVELQAYVDAQLLENPLLEREGAYDGGDGTDRRDNDLDGSDQSPLDEFNFVDRAIDADVPVDAEAAYGVDYHESNPYDEAGDRSADSSRNNGSASSTSSDGLWENRNGSFDLQTNDLEKSVSGACSLREYLSTLVGLELERPSDKLIAVHLIDSLDESGYIPADLSNLEVVLGCSRNDILETLDQMQRIAPPGIFARSLAECLALQLRDRGRLTKSMKSLMSNLDLLAKNDWSRLCKVCGVDTAAIAEMVAELRRLDPKPALAFDAVASTPIMADVVMRPLSDGGWRVELANEALPRLLVNNAYYSLVKKQTRNENEKQFIAECYHSANWLIKSLHQRATTILKVATEIVRQQDGFFAHGVRALRPMILRDIAVAIEMHESTVSRVTTNKFISTPRGIFELKYFFSNAVGDSDGGDSHSAEAVRHRIKSMIDAESRRSILSDDAIAHKLKVDGVSIARRTVAKYREAMGIPSSMQRRRAKANQM